MKVVAAVRLTLLLTRKLAHSRVVQCLRLGKLISIAHGKVARVYGPGILLKGEDVTDRV